MSTWVALLCLTLVLRGGQSSWVIQKSSDGGYSKILVAIHRDVPENKKLIQNIKDLFTQASPILCKATKGTFFELVSISVPNTWRSSPDYTNDTEDPFLSAHFRVEAPSPRHGDEPYTLQPEGCGMPGRYTHWTPNYLLHKPESIWPAKKNEKQDMRLVQEWAHLRYGLFDEYGYPGDPQFPNFYYDKDKTRHPTRCTNDIKGSLQIDCDLNIPEGEADKFDVVNCSFVPTNEYVDNAASIMFTASVLGVEHFCDDNGVHAHNSKAPNKHNDICKGSSAWNVLKAHKDFNSEEAKRLMDKHEMVGCSRTPIFTVLRVPGVNEGRQVLVMDTSASMLGRPMQLLRNATSRAIQDLTEGSRLGIVSFSTSAKTIANLTVVSNTSKSQLIKLLPSADARGSTAIGKGLLQGLEVLKAGGNFRGGRITLITDGEENRSPYIDDVIERLKTAGVQVVGIAYGIKATAKLERLASETGGEVFFFGELEVKNTTSAALDSAFFEATSFQTTEEFQPVKIVDENINLTQDWSERLILVEEALGKNLVVTLTSPGIKNVQMTLIDPNGKSLGPESTMYYKDEVLQRIKVTIPKAIIGTWRISFRSSNGLTTASLTVRSYPQNSGSNTSRPLRIRAWVDNLQPRYPSAVRILAQVTQGGQIDEKRFNVVATVHGPLTGKESVDVILRDNGADPDVTKDDGIYSGYFTQYTANGRYAVVVRMQEIAGTAKSSEGVLRFYRATMEEARLERVVDAGSFRLEAFTEEDMIPPSRVTDLQATVERERRDRIWISWTAPGNDMTHGKASSLELRMAYDPDELRHSFSSCEIVNDWFAEDVTIKMGGELQQAELQIPKGYESTNDTVSVFLFAIRAADDAGNMAEISNVASATFLPVKSNKPSVVTDVVTEVVTEVVTDALPLKDDTDLLVPLVIGGCGLLLLIVLAGLLFMFIRKRNLRRRKKEYMGVPLELKNRDDY